MVLDYTRLTDAICQSFQCCSHIVLTHLELIFRQEEFHQAEEDEQHHAAFHNEFDI